MASAPLNRISEIRYAGWAAYVSGITANLGFVSLILFFSLKSTPNSAQSPHFGVPVSDIAPVLQMLGVVLLQLLLVIKVIVFEQEVGLVLIATAAVGAWLILVNLLGRRQGSLPSRLTWLGMAVGAAIRLESVMLSAAGGAVAWRVFMSNYLLLAGSAVVFLGPYVSFPVWGVWLGRVFRKTPVSAES